MKPVGFGRRHRLRVELDRKDWSKEPFVTWSELHTMSLDTANKLAFSGDWKASESRHGMINLRHPDNVGVAHTLLPARARLRLAHG